MKSFLILHELTRRRFSRFRSCFAEIGNHMQSDRQTNDDYTDNHDVLDHKGETHFRGTIKEYSHRCFQIPGYEKNGNARPGRYRKPFGNDALELPTLLRVDQSQRRLKDKLDVYCSPPIQVAVARRWRKLMILSIMLLSPLILFLNSSPPIHESIA